MSRFQIGRIEGRWKNFLPPYQGGVFRPHVEGMCDEPETEDAASDRSDSSRSASPVFDDGDMPSARRRGVVGKAESVTSASSVGEDEPDEGLAYLNAITRELLDIDEEIGRASCRERVF